MIEWILPFGDHVPLFLRSSPDGHKLLHLCACEIYSVGWTTVYGASDNLRPPDPLLRPLRSNSIDLFGFRLNCKILGSTEEINNAVWLVSWTLSPRRGTCLANQHSSHGQCLLPFRERNPPTSVASGMGLEVYNLLATWNSGFFVAGTLLHDATSHLTRPSMLLRQIPCHMDGTRSQSHLT